MSSKLPRASETAVSAKPKARQKKPAASAKTETSTRKSAGVKSRVEGTAAAKASRSGEASRAKPSATIPSARTSSSKGGRNKTFDSFFDETNYETAASASSASSPAAPPAPSSDGIAKRSATRKKPAQQYENKQVPQAGNKQAQQLGNKQTQQADKQQVRQTGRQAGAAKPAARKKKKRKTSKRNNPIKLLFRVVFIGACVVLAWCLYAYYIIVANEQQPLLKADAGVILGAALWNEQPSPALKERLDYAIELYEAGMVDYLILSGGKPHYDRGLSEAEGMEHYLVAAGIPQDKLLLETQSRDTYENLTFSERVAKKHDLTSIMIITHNYHTKRAEDIAVYIGMKHVQTAGVKTTVLNESYHYTREMLAYTKWQLNKLLMPLGIMI